MKLFDWGSKKMIFVFLNIMQTAYFIVLISLFAMCLKVVVGVHDQGYFVDVSSAKIIKFIGNKNIEK